MHEEWMQKYRESNPDHRLMPRSEIDEPLYRCKADERIMLFEGKIYVVSLNQVEKRR